MVSSILCLWYLTNSINHSLPRSYDYRCSRDAFTIISNWGSIKYRKIVEIWTPMWVNQSGVHELLCINQPIAGICSECPHLWTTPLWQIKYHKYVTKNLLFSPVTYTIWLYLCSVFLFFSLLSFIFFFFFFFQYVKKKLWRQEITEILFIVQSSYWRLYVSLVYANAVICNCMEWRAPLMHCTCTALGCTSVWQRIVCYVIFCDMIWWIWACLRREIIFAGLQ